MKSQHLSRETVRAPFIVGRKHGKGGSSDFCDEATKLWLDLMD